MHYAAATHKLPLVQQLLDLGASPWDEEGTFGLRPLHFACMGAVKNAAGIEELMDACEDIYSLQVRTVQLLPNFIRLVDNSSCCQRGQYGNMHAVLSTLLVRRTACHACTHSWQVAGLCLQAGAASV
jgi:hypothetical protein